MDGRTIGTACLALTAGYCLAWNAYCGDPTIDKPIETSVCAIHADPVSYDGKPVRVRLRVESDGIERTFGRDRSCPESGVMLSLLKGVGDYAGVDTLRAVIFSGLPGTLDKEVVATVVGTVKNEKAAGRGIVIKLLRAEDIEI